MTPSESPLHFDFRNDIFNQLISTSIIPKTAIKKVVKNHHVVNAYNLDWPTYAITLRPRQNSGLSKAITNQPELP